MGHCIESVPLFSYAIVLAKKSFSSRRERSQFVKLFKGDWGFPQQAASVDAEALLAN